MNDSLSTAQPFSAAEHLYTAEQIRVLDSCAINEHGIAGTTLMSRAAAATLAHLLQRWPDAASLQVFCGKGNNGGDGYLIADQAHKRGIDVVAYQVGDASGIAGDALAARNQALANGVKVEGYAGQVHAEGVIVDAMLGIGLSGDVRPDYAAAIGDVNHAGLPVVAVDIPSGLCADSGMILGSAVRADLTVTYIGLKRGLFAARAPDCVGELELSDLAVPQEVYRAVDGACYRLELDALLESVEPRAANAHKGLYGNILVVGGDYTMAGAVVLAAEAALRCGAGLVRVATRAEHIAALIARTPEAMPIAVEEGDALLALAASADVLVVGPGLGQSSWAESLLQAALSLDKPMVLDADALNLLAASSGLSKLPRTNWVLTPHPAEAARLLGIETRDVQADRFQAVEALQQRYGGVVVLKGNGSLIADGAAVLLSDYGNPGMASGGMGDVLSGVVGALLGQKLSPTASAALGVCLHGAAADVAAADGERGLLASDLMAPMRALLG
ncbi:MAG: NAD(P)H-hydrate dehydratase [Halioglobus sp.]